MEWNLSQLASLRTIARETNFTRAAVVLGISQPAISKQIADLESTLGVKVVDRGSRRATLTDAGALLLTYAERIVAMTNEAEHALADLSSLRRGRLRIGATPTIGTYLLPKSLVYFRSRFQDIEVAVEIQSAAMLLARLGDGALDVVLSPRQLDDSSARAFMTDTLVAVCGKTHALAKRRKIDWVDLASTRLILRDGPRQATGYVERLLRARKCVPRSALRLPQTEAVKQAALAGVGVAFLPRICVNDELVTGRLKRLAVDGFQLKRPYYLVERETAQRPRAVRAYACVLKHAVRGSLPAVRG